MAGTASTKSHTTTNRAVRGGRGTREPAAVDGTAVGDAFCAARACAAGALAASRPGVQPSLPTAAELGVILAR